MKVGIVGLPNAGKSSLFNALTKAGAEAANYPFTTVDPNVAVVPVRDERLDAVAQTLGSSEVIYDTLEVHDIAGLVRGAHEGEGLGNQFLANIRETDAILHVVRSHDDSGVVHPEGRVDPAADLETIEAELLYADLEQAERRVERVARQAKSLDKAAVAEEKWLRELIEALGAGRPARSVPVPADAPDALVNLQPLTAKPVLFVANVSEGDLTVPEPVAAHAAAAGGSAVAVSSRLEAELAELDDKEAAAMREEMGGAHEALDTLVKGAFELLDLISFFTAGEGKEARAYAITRGTSAQAAAEKIHTDIAKGFVRAEILGWRDLVDAGGYAGARDTGKLRVEGRDYTMADGEVMTVRFTP
jgi:GTP-binding protein YchF